MEQAVFIRKMVEADIDAVVNMYAEVLHPDYISFSELAEGKAERSGQLSERAIFIFREQLVTLLESNRHGFFVATTTENNEITGFAFASIHTTEAGHEECWLDDIGVKSSSQQHGIGIALVHWILDWGIQRRAKYVLLESGMQNDSAHHLFERLGFQPLSIVFYRDLPNQPE